MVKTVEKKEKWEYHILLLTEDLTRNSNKTDFKLRERELNRLGREGWELVSVVKEKWGFDGEDTMYHFKRKK